MLSETLGELTKASILIQKGDNYYIIERLFTSPPSEPLVYQVTASGLEEVRGISDIESFFKIKSFSQSEIIEVAREPEARTSLIDDLIDIDEQCQAIEDVKEMLRQNSDAIVTTRTEILTMENQLTKLGEIQENIKSLQTILSDKSLIEHQKWHEEEQYFNTADNFLKALEDDIKNMFEALDVSLFPKLLDDTPNKKMLKNINNLHIEIQHELKSSETNLVKKLREKISSLKGIHKKWLGLFNDEEKENEKRLKELDTLDQDFEALEKQMNGFRKQEISLLSKQDNLEIKVDEEKNLFKERNNLLTELQKNRQAIHKKRVEKAEDLKRKLNGKIRIKVSLSSNRETYFSKLEKLLEGTRMRGDEIKKVCRELHPINLAKLVLTNNSERLAKTSGIDIKWAKRLIEHFLSDLNLREILILQSQDVDDLVKISFKVGETR